MMMDAKLAGPDSYILYPFSF